MEPNYVIGGIVFVCLIGMSVLFIMVIPTRESILNWLLWKNIEHRESEEQKYLIELAERGEIAPQLSCPLMLQVSIESKGIMLDPGLFMKWK